MNIPSAMRDWPEENFKHQTKSLRQDKGSLSMASTAITTNGTNPRPPNPNPDPWPPIVQISRRSLRSFALSTFLVPLRIIFIILVFGGLYHVLVERIPMFAIMTLTHLLLATPAIQALDLLLSRMNAAPSLGPNKYNYGKERELAVPDCPVQGSPQDGALVQSGWSSIPERGKGDRENQQTLPHQEKNIKWRPIIACIRKTRFWSGRWLGRHRRKGIDMEERKEGRQRHDAENNPAPAEPGPPVTPKHNIPLFGDPVGILKRGVYIRSNASGSERRNLLLVMFELLVSIWVVLLIHEHRWKYGS